jgi:hypothetical protein
MFDRIRQHLLLLVCGLYMPSLIFAQPIQEIGDVQRFDKQSTGAFEIHCGKGVTAHVQTGVELGNQKDLLALTFDYDDTLASNAGWFVLNLSKPLNFSQDQQPEGIGIELLADPSGMWWLKARIHQKDKRMFGCLLKPGMLESKLRSRLFALTDFHAGNKEDHLECQAGDRFSLNGSVYRNRTLYIKRIFLYRHVKPALDKPVTFHTNAPVNNLFEPGTTVTLNFDGSKGFASQAAGLQCVVRDYFDRMVFEHTFTSAAKSMQVHFTPENPGFYDVQAWWVDAQGRKLDNVSCIATTGSMPQGHGTFAVMPKTIEQNLQRIERVGDDSFLGFFGKHSNVKEMLGVSWQVDCKGWQWLEPKARPDRSHGMAQWARDVITNQPERPAWQRSIVNLNLNLHRPAWALSDKPDVAPGIKDWSMFFDFFRDYVQMNKHLSAQMSRRIYDVLWEVNLNQPGIGIHKPDYRPRDIIEVYRRARQVVDNTDPGALLVGPCCSSPIKNYAWNIPLFEQGLLQYLDAYNCHGYHAPPPEEAKIPQTLARLHQDFQKYNHGKDLPIYVTELGYRSQYGPKDRQKDHARWHVRAAAIFKGEGVRVYQPFYGYDFSPNPSTSWGLCYNLGSKPKGAPEYVSPKAAVPAIAVFADQTEGLKPVTRLTGLSDDLWGYVYASAHKTLAMLWSVNRQHHFILPVGDVKQVTVTDMMGVSKVLAVHDGMVELDVTPSPIYISGLSSRLYPADRTIKNNQLATLYPGDEKQLDIVGTDIFCYGKVQVYGTTIAVQPDCPAGLVPVCWQRNGQPKVGWLTIRQPLAIQDSQLVAHGSRMYQHVTLYNHAQQTMDVQLRLSLDRRIQTKRSLTLTGNSEKQLVLPLDIDSYASPLHTFNIRLELISPSQEPVLVEQAFNLLAAHKIGESDAGKFNHLAQWSGQGASGQTDNARASFSWNDDALVLDVMVHDDVFDQRITDGTIWQQDSIQIYFDTDPQQTHVYDPMAGIFDKKLTSLAFAQTSNGPLAWRHVTHNVQQLPLGEISKDVQMKVSRDEQAHITHYHLEIPWPQIGLDHVQAGKRIGLSILVNDSDGPDTRRAMYELFTGATTRRPENNGSLLLQ